MTKTLSVRLDDESEYLLKQLKGRWGCSTSEIVNWPQIKMPDPKGQKLVAFAAYTTSIYCPSGGFCSHFKTPSTGHFELRSE